MWKAKEKTIKEEGVEMKKLTGKTLVRNIESTQSLGRSEDRETEEEIGETNPAILLCILFLFPLTQCLWRVAL